MLNKRLLHALYLSEREALFEPLSFYRGRKKFNAWKRLRGFGRNASNLRNRLLLSNINASTLRVLLGQRTPSPLDSSEHDWLSSCLIANDCFPSIENYRERFPSIAEYLERGFINPFLPLVVNAALELKKSSGASDRRISLMLAAQLGSIEQLTRRAVILSLHIESTLAATNDDSRTQFNIFLASFEDPEKRLRFFETYPVLLRSVKSKLDNWVHSTSEFLTRLNHDRPTIADQFGIPEDALLSDVATAGDTHNNGRAVLLLKFSSNDSLVYKPRSVKLEGGFQEYLRWCNKEIPDVSFRLIRVAERPGYGWVEFVEHAVASDEQAAEKFYYRLGVLTALVYSINGVDIFFENLVAAGDQPVVVDLETMFHTSLENHKPVGPRAALQNWLYTSIGGIGILPQPGIGSSDTEIFDISVMGARTDAKAPYKVSGIENFGRADMRITEVSGWIPEAKSNSKSALSKSSKGLNVLKGLETGFGVILKHKNELSRSDGLIYRWFANAERRLIVRDTKTYGTLQQDESHPDFLRSQLDREWHWDNLWSDIVDRPFLKLFIGSELRQMRQGDIPYFFGPVDSMVVTGGDGSIVDLQSILRQTPLELVIDKLNELSEQEVAQQVRIAATQLGLPRIEGVTQPVFRKDWSNIELAVTVAHFIDQRINAIDCMNWCDTSVNPVPKSQEDPVTVVPIDPFLYDGLSGVAMFFCDISGATGDVYWEKRSIELFWKILEEVEFESRHAVSGFNGLAAVVYAINRCMAVGDGYSMFEPHLSKLVRLVKIGLESEANMDVLGGLAGTGLGLLPFAKRTKNREANKLLALVYKKLIYWAATNCDKNEAVGGIEFMRGFSHGLSGIALAIHRLGDYLKDDESLAISRMLLLKESILVAEGGWTDRHQYQGKDLVGWCHGSSGIALAMSEISRRLEPNDSLQGYYRDALENTLRNGFFDSHCLCHGSVGNLLALEACDIDQNTSRDLSNRIITEILAQGFCSFGSAQTMGIGLMTGLAGCGYLFLSKSGSEIDAGFLTLK